jgi:fibronectin type 3 domain-containing protein
MIQKEKLNASYVGPIKHLVWILVGLLCLLASAGAQAQLVPTNNPPRVLLSWDPNPETDIGGYKIYYGTNSRVYTVVTNVGKTTNAVTAGYTRGVRYYWAATAYNTNNLESDLSEEVSLLIPVKPIHVTNLTVNVQP